MSDTYTSETRVVAVDEHIATEIGDEVVILQLDAGRYYGIDGIGPEVWKLLQRPRTVNELLGRIVANYDVTLERARRDTVALLEELDEKELIERHDV